MQSKASNLRPSEPKATKDCRVCNRRRIRCDRSLPTCVKCAGRNLDCPGYGLRIQWGQGVASRGRLKGKTIPKVVDESPASTGSSQSVSISTASPVEAPDAQHDLAELQGHDAMVANAQAWLSRTEGTRSQYALDLRPTSLPLPLNLHESVGKLLRYYDHVVAAIMPWVDGPDNMWRREMIPLALGCPVLLFALLALAAGQYASKNKSHHAQDSVYWVSYYRNRSLSILAVELQELNQDSKSWSSTPKSSTLAAMLVLSHLEIIRSDAWVWRVHWNAMKTITQAWTARKGGVFTLDTTDQFLFKEAFVYDSFASITIFDNSDYIPWTTMLEQDTTVFVEYLHVLRHVTQAERHHHDNVGGTEGAVLNDIGAVRQAFTRARDRDLELQKDLPFQSTQDREDFIILIHIYHHAGLLYAAQAIAPPEDRSAALHAELQATIRQLTQVQQSTSFQHDLVLPFFLIGTEAKTSDELQLFVKEGLSRIMESTAFENCHAVLGFLTRFWATDHSGQDWLAHARRESQMGIRFIVI